MSSGLAASIAAKASNPPTPNTAGEGRVGVYLLLQKGNKFREG